MSSKSGESKKKIKLNIKWTGLYELDEMFRAAAAPLQTLDELSSSITDSSEVLKKVTFTHVVVGCTLTDSILGMLFCFSANFDGVLDALEFKIKNDPPYLGINKKKLPKDVVHIYEAFEDVVKALLTAPGQIQELQPQIQNLIEESKEFPDRAEVMCKNNNMGPMELIKTTKRVMKNVNKIANAKRVIDETVAMSQAMMKTMESLNATYESNKDRIMDVGKSARKENLLHPKQIIPKFWIEPEKINMKLDVPPKPVAQKK